MSDLESKRLARLQSEADRARRQLTPNGLAICAGMDGQGRILITQGGTTRPLDQYQSNAGAAYGQPLEVSEGFGMVAPRRPAPALETSRRIKQATWWAIMQVDAGASWQYWLGGNLQEPIQVFSAPKLIPGCARTARLYARYYSTPQAQVFARTIFPTPVQRGQINNAVDTYWRMPFCQYLQIMGQTHEPYFPPFGVTYSPGTGPFSVVPNPSNSASPPYFLPQVSASTICGIAPGVTSYLTPTEPLFPDLPNASSTECQIEFYQSYLVVRIKGLGHALNIGQDALIQNSSAGVISSYPLPIVPRSSEATASLAISARNPYVRLQHSRQCLDTYQPPYTFDQVKTVSNGETLAANWPQFPEPTSQLYGTDAFYFLASGGISVGPQGPIQGNFPVTIERRQRGPTIPGTLLTTIRTQAQQRWQWPTGTLQAVGYVV